MYFKFTTEDRQTNSSACNYKDTDHGDHTSLVIPLSKVGFNDAPPGRGPLQEEELIDQLSNKRHPVCGFVEWTNGTGYHAIAIVGIDPMRDQHDNRIYIVGDPLYSIQKVSYEQLCKSYHNIGKWIVTFTLS